MSKLDIFVSHLTIESKLAELLKGHLQRDFIGLLRVFVSSDKASIPVGAKWLDDVMSALRSARMQIVLCSEQSVTRPWINFEAGAAYLRGIQVVPFCHSGLTTAQLPVPLSASQGIDAGDADSLSALYVQIAAMLDCDVPGVDFDRFAGEVSEFEREYAQTRQRIEANQASLNQASGVAVEIIRNPTVLCVSSPQFLELGFENDLQSVLKAFPSAVTHERSLTSDQLRSLLQRQPFDIVHIAVYVCPKTGDLIFSDVDPSTGKSEAGTVDCLSADEFSALLEMAHTKLVVLASCDSLVLAARVLEVASVVAAKDLVSTRAMAEWVRAFYGVLTTHKLEEAFEFAKKASRAPMVLYKQRDMLITLEQRTTDAVGAAASM